MKTVAYAGFCSVCLCTEEFSSNVALLHCGILGAAAVFRKQEKRDMQPRPKWFLKRSVRGKKRTHQCWFFASKLHKICSVTYRWSFLTRNGVNCKMEKRAKIAQNEEGQARETDRSGQTLGPFQAVTKQKTKPNKPTTTGGQQASRNSRDVICSAPSSHGADQTQHKVYVST